MTTGLLRFRHVIVLACLLPALRGPAYAADDVEGILNQIVELNKKALAAYAKLDMEGAATLLEQALATGKSANLEKHPTAARTHVHLGIVYLTDPNRRKLAITEFQSALAIDPEIRIAKSLNNPEVQAAFEEALVAGGKVTLPTVPEIYAESAQPLLPSGPRVSTHAFVARLNHPPVTQAFRNHPVAVRAHVPPGLGAAKVLLAYRAPGGPEFLARQMIPVEGNNVGWFQESIPVEATSGQVVSYYIEARDDNDEPIARSGSPEGAHFVALESEALEADGAALPGGARRIQPAKVDPGRPPGFWFVLGVGTGFGYHRGTPELHREASGPPPGKIETSGFALSQLIHLAPEMGFIFSERWVLSVQGRFQLVAGVDDARVKGQELPAAHFATAGLLKLTRLLAWSKRGFRPFASLAAGVGEIRHSIRLPWTTAVEGCPSKSNCTDTVLGGLGLAGMGVGFTYALSNSLAFYAALNLLAAFPHVMVNGDLSVGLAILR